MGGRRLPAETAGGREAVRAPPPARDTPSRPPFFALAMAFLLQPRAWVVSVPDDVPPSPLSPSLVRA